MRLEPLQPGLDAARLASELAPGFGGDPDGAREVLEQTVSLLAREPRPDPWGSYLAHCEDGAVGLAAFKSAPDETGTVDPEDGLVWRWERACGG